MATPIWACKTSKNTPGIAESFNFKPHEWPWRLRRPPHLLRSQRPSRTMPAIKIIFESSKSVDFLATCEGKTTFSSRKMLIFRFEYLCCGTVIHVMRHHGNQPYKVSILQCQVVKLSSCCQCSFEETLSSRKSKGKPRNSSKCEEMQT